MTAIAINDPYFLYYIYICEFNVSLATPLQNLVANHTASWEF